MTRIACHVPITIRLTGTPTDAQLARVGETLARAIAARLCEAERTIGNRLGRPVGAGDTVRIAEPYLVARETAGGNGYVVPSYDEGGRPVVVPLVHETESPLAPFRRVLRWERQALATLVRRGAPDADILRQRRVVWFLQADLAGMGRLLPRLHPSAVAWHAEVLERANRAPTAAQRDAIEAKRLEYARLAGWLRSARDRSFRHADVPRKGISYLIYENDETQRALDAMAEALHPWFRANELDPELLRHDAWWGLFQMLDARPDLLVAYREAQLLPVGHEKLHVGIHRPLFVIVVELMVSFVPYIGQVVALGEAYSGSDLFGYELDDFDRAVLAATALVPFARHVVRGGRALYTTEQLVRLYGRDAVQWSRMLAGAEHLAARPAEVQLLEESASLVRSGGHLAADERRLGRVQSILRDLVDAIRGARHAAEAPFRSPELGRIALDADALERVLAKGRSMRNAVARVHHMKGELLEELLARRVRELLSTQEGAALLGVRDLWREVQFIPGRLIRDHAGRQLTDGMLVVRRGNRMHVVAIFEAKAGSASAERLARESSKLPRSGLKELGREQGTEGRIGGPVQHRVIQSELGGQIRKDVERLYPAGGAGETRIFVDGQEIELVGLSPKTTPIFGVLPWDIAAQGIVTELRGLGYRAFGVLGMNVTERQLEQMARDIWQHAR